MGPQSSHQNFVSRQQVEEDPECPGHWASWLLGASLEFRCGSFTGMYASGTGL